MVRHSRAAAQIRQRRQAAQATEATVAANRPKRARRNASWSASAISAFKAYYATDRSRVTAESLLAPGGMPGSLIAAGHRDLARLLRQLERNNDSIRAIVAGHRADIIGTGISVIPDTGDARTDSTIKRAWQDYEAAAGAAGESMMELQRMAIGEWDCSGNPFARLVYDASRASDGRIPLAVIPLEIEWLATQPVEDVPAGLTFAYGIIIDDIGRPVYYDIVNPDTGASERVPASSIVHAFERKVPRQVIGEPNLCAVIERSAQRGRLIDTEIHSAINASAWTTWIEQQAGAGNDGFPANSEDYDENSDGGTDPISDVRPGAHYNAAEGEKLHLIQATRPNTDVTLFASALNGGLAAAAGVSKVWLDRDGSQYNFANARFDQIRSKMLIRPVQEWFGPQYVSRIYRAVLPLIAAAEGIAWPTDSAARMRLMRHRLQPDVPPELDEKGAAEALATMLENNGTTLEQWHGERGRDWEQVIEQRAREVERMRALGLIADAARETSNA